MSLCGVAGRVRVHPGHGGGPAGSLRLRAVRQPGPNRPQRAGRDPFLFLLHRIRDCFIRVPHC